MKKYPTIANGPSILPSPLMLIFRTNFSFMLPLPSTVPPLVAHFILAANPPMTIATKRHYFSVFNHFFFPQSSPPHTQSPNINMPKQWKMNGMLRLLPAQRNPHNLPHLLPPPPSPLTISRPLLQFCHNQRERQREGEQIRTGACCCCCTCVFLYVLPRATSFIFSWYSSLLLGVPGSPASRTR